MVIYRLQHISLLALCALALSLACGSPLKASSVVNITRASTPGSDKAAEFIDFFMGEELRSKAQWESLQPLLHKNKAWLKEADAAFTNGRSKIKAGLTEFENFELDKAIDNFNAALSLFERHVEAITDYQEVSELLLVLGATHIFRGEEELGYERLIQALTLATDIQPDPAIFNPRMRNLFDQARDEVADNPNASMLIKSTPGYAKIFVDGKFMGVSPQSLKKIKVGRHFIRIEKDGYRPWGKIYRVRKDRKNEILANLEAFNKYDAFDSLCEEFVLSSQYAPENLQGSVSKLGEALKANFLLASIVEADGNTVNLKTSLWNVVAGKELKSAKTTFSKGRSAHYQKEIEEFYEANFNEALTSPQEETEVFALNETSYGGAPTCMGIRCDVLQRNVFITGLALGAATVVSGLVLNYLAYQDNLDYRNQVQISQQAQDLRTSGERKAIIGDVLWAFGSASILTGLGVYFFWQPPAYDEGNPEEQSNRSKAYPTLSLGLQGKW